MINGQGGTDTLNLAVVDGSSGLPSGVQLNSVEVLNINNITSGSEFETTSGAVEANKLSGVKQIWQENNATAAVTGVAADQTIGFRKTEADSLGTVTAAAAATSASVAFDGAAYATSGSGIDLTVDGATGSKLDTINLSGTIAKPAAAASSWDAPVVNLDAQIGAAAESFTLNTAVKTDVTLSKSATSTKDVTTIDAGQSTGDIEFATSGSGFANIETITLGSGKDSLTVNQAGEDTTVNLGAGNDTVTVNFHGAAASGAASKNLEINLGEGNDTLKLGSEYTTSGTVAAADEEFLTNTLVTVGDFADGEDTIDVTGFSITSFATQSTIDGLVSEDNTLFQNVSAVVANSATTNSNLAQFVFDGDLYLVADNGTAGTYGEDDVVIKLAGVTELLSGADVEGIA